MNEKICIQVRTSTSYEAVDMFKYLYEHFLKDEKFAYAEIFYNKRLGLYLDSKDSENWPLQIFTMSGIRISVFSVTAGYGGSGPMDMKAILDKCGFKDTDQVLTSNGDIVHLKLYP